jgi:hypothetical protein
VQAVNSGANSYICYGCASIVKNICYFSKPEMLQELLKDANIPRQDSIFYMIAISKINCIFVVLKLPILDG